MPKILLVILCLVAVFQASAQDGYEHTRTGGSRIVSGLGVANNTGPGIGIQYEQITERNRKLSCVAHVAVCFSYVAGSTSPRSARGNNYERPAMVFMTPGFRYYPKKTGGIVRYSLGGNLMIGVGAGRGNTYRDGHNVLQSRGIFGVLVTNGLNFQFGKYIRASLEMDLGVGEDSGLNSAAGPGFNPLGQVSCGVGYRW